MKALLPRDDQGPGNAGAFAHPREQLRQLEGLARQELRALQRQAAAQPAAPLRCHEEASLAWDLGLDIR